MTYKTLSPQTLSAEIETPPKYSKSNQSQGFLGTSAAIQDIYEKIEHAAPSQATVFITGGSGTGKEVCAETIHKLSPRANKPFVPVNCAAIPGDLIESELFGHVAGVGFPSAASERQGAMHLAEGGTIFLDEITEMNPDMQSKFLRFLQNYTFKKMGAVQLEQTDVRIICATNRDPLAEIKNGSFREDLYYRLHVIPIEMPPLRERGEDVLDIALTLLRQYALEERKSFKVLSENAEFILRSYHWPGNIRELQNVIRNIVVMHDQEIVTPELLPAVMFDKNPSSSRHNNMDANSALSIVAGITPLASPRTIKPLTEIEREVIENAITQCDGNIPRAAALLEVAPSTIYRKKSTWDKQDSPGMTT